MARRSKEPEGEAPVDLGWMATFADLVTLLITFFVLLLSMSSLDTQALDEASGFFNGRLGALGTTSEPSSVGGATDVVDAPIMPSLRRRAGTPREIIRFETNPSEIPSVEPDDPQLELSPEIQQALDVAEAHSKAEKIEGFSPLGSGAGTRERFERVLTVLKRPELKDIFTVTLHEDKLRILLDGDLLFLEGRVRIDPRSLILLQRIAEAIDGLGLETRVVGVVPGKGPPIERTDLYPTTWDLAAARGCNVLRYVLQKTHTPPTLLSCSATEPAPDDPARAAGVLFELRAPTR